jgi:hypothetical protein
VRNHRIPSARTAGPEAASVRLHDSAGPKNRLYINGALAHNHDYIETAALNAAESCCEDPVLGPFYRSVAEAENREREKHLTAYRRDILNCSPTLILHIYLATAVSAVLDYDSVAFCSWDEGSGRNSAKKLSVIWG